MSNNKKTHYSPEPRTMNTVQAAKYLGDFSEGFLRKLRANDAGPSFVKVGQKIMYTPTALDEYIVRNATVTGEMA